MCFERVLEQERSIGVYPLFCSVETICLIICRALELDLYEPKTKQYSRYGRGRVHSQFNLYADRSKVDPMKIEKEFSALETTFGNVAKRIKEACHGDKDCVHISPYERTELYKFMFLSSIRLKSTKAEFMDDKRKNNFVYQDLFNAERLNSHNSTLSRPEQIWLNRLDFLLGASHQRLLEVAKEADAPSDVLLYNHFFNRYNLQIWTAGYGQEFFLSDHFVDFEGDTNSFLAIDREKQICHVTASDRIHIWMPVSPKIVIAFCSPSRCWHNPPELQMTSTKDLLPNITMLDNAPHKDPIVETVQLDAHNKADKWRINIAELPEQFHFVLVSYTLMHTSDLIIFTEKFNLETALGEFESFLEMRQEAWEARGYRWLGPTTKIPESDDLIEGITAISEKLRAKERPTGSREDVKTYFTVLTSVMSKQYNEELSDYVIRNGPGYKGFIERLQREFPPKRPEHLDLISLGFWEFAQVTLDEAHFMMLIKSLCEKMQQETDHDKSLFAHKMPESEVDGSPLQSDGLTEPKVTAETDIDGTMYYQMAYALGAMQWLYEERQDIIVHFLEPILDPRLP